ncbi:MAG: Hsp70 family protein [Nakamurella sp.]
MRMLSIDFGTSNTVVALAVDGQAPRTITFDASPLLPSAVFVAADGSVTVGREAQRQARLDPARYEANPKRRIDDGEVLLGDRVVGVVDLIAAVLRNVAAEVRRQLGGAAPDEVRLPHPAQWGATRQNTLVSAARSAGLGNNLVLIPEPVAAAAQYTRLPGRTLAPGGTVAVYDLGGGTFDIAVVGRTQNDFHVLAEAGLADLGGLDFDQAVLDHVGRGTSAADPARWQQILRPSDASSRRAARALAEDVRAAKETLSRYPQTEVALPDPFNDMHLTRPEFEGLIRPNLVRSIEVLQTTLRNAGVGPDRLTGIFLVGGSSRIPLVAKLIQQQLGVTPVALDQPETAVALGALLVPVHREGNRTVAFGPSSAGNSNSVQGQQGAVQQGIGPSSAGQRALSGAAQSGPAVSGPVSSTAGRSGPLPTSVLPAGSPKSRTSLWVAIGVVAVLVVATVVLLVAKPFSGKADEGSSTPTTVSSGTETGTSGSTGSGSQTAKSSSSGN